ncbi:AAA family ATPase [Tsukamurella sp. DT100]|uniref:AAA family ATPase n=1 Tax=Tsukamurella sp. DT100 TaxID=3393415 RepID=UPI003CF9F654
MPADADVWFSPNPLSLESGLSRKGGEADVERGVALWADLDVVIPGLKDKGLASLAECGQVIEKLTAALGCAPAVVIESGHGLQPIWRVRDAPLITDRAVAWKTISARWEALVRQTAATVNPDAHVDSVFNIDRVLRCPGSTNWKFPDEPVPVRCYVSSGAGWLDVAELSATLPDADAAAPVHQKATLEAGEAVLATFRSGPMSAKVAAKVHDVEKAMSDGADRHAAMNRVTMGLVGLGVKGEPGVRTALTAVEALFSELAGSAGHDPREFQRSLDGALRQVAGDPDYRPLDYGSGARVWLPDGSLDPASALGRSFAAARSRPGTPEGAGAVFKLMGPDAWAQPVAPPEFLVKGVLVRDTFGVIAGPKKSLKTHENHALALAVATGQPLYNHAPFAVPKAGRVLYIVGEGGQGDVQRKLQRMCRTYGVDPRDVAEDEQFPLHVAFGATSMNDPRFQDELKAMLDATQPDLVLIESFYNFHPEGVETGNLYQRGQAIDSFHKFVRGECTGATSLMTDHYRSTGNKGTDLDMIAMAGQAEVADSWITRYHRAEADVENGEFRLRVAFGSRQWGGRELDIDWSLGRFDPETGSHVGAGEHSDDDSIRWAIHRSGGTSSPEAERASLTMQIYNLVKAQPGQLTKTGVKESGHVKGRKEAIAAEVDRLLESGTLRSEGRKLWAGPLTFQMGDAR